MNNTNDIMKKKRQWRNGGGVNHESYNIKRKKRKTTKKITNMKKRNKRKAREKRKRSAIKKRWRKNNRKWNERGRRRGDPNTCPKVARKSPDICLKAADPWGIEATRTSPTSCPTSTQKMVNQLPESWP